MRIGLLLVLGACTSSASDVEDSVTIERGMYGRLSSSDSGDPSAGPFVDGGVTAYVNGNVVASATSDANGVYQLGLAGGTYTVCTLGADPETIYDQWLHNCAGKCTFITLGDELVRRDWAGNLSGGWWDGDEHCPRR